MFSFIKDRLTKIYSSVTSRLGGLFGKKTIDEEVLQELKILLLSADTGVTTTNNIITELKKRMQSGTLETGSDLKECLREILFATLSKLPQRDYSDTKVFVMVGVNGSGKTTFISKLAYKLKKEDKKVLLVAADTFRAAAPEQLNTWAQRYGIDIHQGVAGQDPASVVFGGCQKFKDDGYDAIIIDTAGRLHTKVNLMNELGKITKVIKKQLPDEKIATLLTVDAMLGQNSFEQAKLFSECADVDSIVLTKMDGTGKGGIVFAIAQQLQLPVWCITFGEQPEDMSLFNAREYVDQLLEG